MSYSNEFRTIDTPEKAYVLGLYYADGYISIKPKKNYHSGITLHLNDSELLRKIKEKFLFFTYIEYPKRNIGYLRLDLKAAVMDLQSNGVLLRKSTENKNNLRFPKISPNLYSHFIRGFFDGDGSICKSKTASRNVKNFSLVCSNYFLLKKIKEILFYEGISLRLTVRKNKPTSIRGRVANFKQLTFSLHRNGNEKVLKKLCKYLYQDSTIHMNRKKELFEEWFIYPDKPTLECPRCGNSSDRLEAKRMFCKKCNHYSQYNRVYYEVKDNFCKHCNSTHVVLNGQAFSRRSKKITGINVLCRDCNRNSVRQILNRRICAPLHSNV